MSYNDTIFYSAVFVLLNLRTGSLNFHSNLKFFLSLFSSVLRGFKTQLWIMVELFGRKKVVIADYCCVLRTNQVTSFCGQVKVFQLYGGPGC